MHLGCFSPEISNVCLRITLNTELIKVLITNCGAKRFNKFIASDCFYHVSTLHEAGHSSDTIASSVCLQVLQAVCTSRVHNGVYTYIYICRSCILCIVYIRKHQMSHGRPWTCTLCSMMFSQQSGCLSAQLQVRDTSSSCVFKQLWSFSATPWAQGRGSVAHRRFFGEKRA